MQVRSFGQVGQISPRISLNCSQINVRALINFEPTYATTPVRILSFKETGTRFVSAMMLRSRPFQNIPEVQKLRGRSPQFPFLFQAVARSEKETRVWQIINLIQMNLISFVKMY